MTTLVASKEKVLSRMDFPFLITNLKFFVGRYYFILSLSMLGNFS